MSVRLTIFCVAMMCMLDSTKPSAAAGTDPEQALCGSLREPLMFWLWQRIAGQPDAARLASIANLEPIRYTTRDGVKLGGYKLAARAPEGYMPKGYVPKGYVLVAQGNAMLADQLVADLQLIREQGFDVYVYDYRGYGRSEGNSRLAAIVDDYAEIIGHLNAQGYDRRMLYAISIGGVMLLNAIGQGQPVDAMVIDSTPSHISGFGCPAPYDPVRHLPQDSRRVLIISGARDTIVSPAQMAELIRVGASRGARIFQHEAFAHPYQDASLEIHRNRLNEVARFFAQQ